MICKFVALVAMVAAVYAVPPGGKYIYKTLEAEHEAPAVYDYHYTVEDHHTGDIKGLQEYRKGHNFQGQYSLLEADGHHRRTVQYAGDEHSGFNADFSYAVEDPHTGDSKSQQESRKGDAVHGQYSLIDADGHRRVVEYSADDHSGFQAVVHREPVQGHQIKVAPAPYHVAKVVAPVVHHAVPLVHHSAPVAYHSAPVGQHVVNAHAPSGVGHYSVSFSNPSTSYHY